MAGSPRKRARRSAADPRRQPQPDPVDVATAAADAERADARPTIARLGAGVLTEAERLGLAIASLDRALLWAADLVASRSTAGSATALDFCTRLAGLARSLTELRAATAGAAGGIVVTVRGFGAADLETGAPREVEP